MDTMVADPLNGALLDGRYRVRGRVARGGFATVYQAIDERLDRIVAIKIVHPVHAGDPQFLRRFTDEAKTIARLTHPNVVAVYDQGSHDGLAYLVMEYVRGRTLREVLQERHRLHPTEALAVLEQVLAAVASAHRAGLVHRDLKPENVLVAPPPNGSGDLVDAVVKVADFGLARAVEAATDADDGGELLATAAYVAPELVSEGRTDSRGDVYSAGIMLFEMLTGRVPFSGARPVEVAWQHVDQDVPPPSHFLSNLPGPVDALVLRATRRDPGARPMDAGLMLAAVQGTRDDVGALTSPTRALVQPTMTVPVSQQDPRPSWARLPGGGTAPTRGVATPSRVGHTGPAGPGPAAWWQTFQQRMTGLLRGVPGQNRQRLLIAAVLAGVLLIAGGWWFGVGRYTETPALVSLSQEAASRAADERGLEVVLGPGVFSEDIPKGTVMAQDPGAGGKIVRGGQVTLQLSLGPERYEVPDLAGKPADFAKTELAAHFTVKDLAGYSDTLPAGYVIGTNPKAGTQAKPGTVVQLTISRGPFPLRVPDVVGKNLNEARGELEGEGLVIGEVKYVQSDKPRDEVLKQTPEGGAGAEKGTTVNLEVSDAPAGIPMPRLIDFGCRDAINALESQQFKVELFDSPLGGDFGSVRDQDPDEGQPVSPGATIRLRCGVF